MALFRKPGFGDNDGRRSKKKEIPEGLWTKCPNCGEVIFNKELQENLMVCPHCDYHMSITATDRILRLCDEGTFEETDTGMRSVDILKFTGVTSYTDRLKSYEKRTGRTDAVTSGIGKIEGLEVSLAAMDFQFLGGSMGSVVGEKLTRAIENATERGIPVIIFSASGGARMYEGMFSLMQMAKTSGALKRHSQKGLPYISVLTNPTTGGVTASFATLGDLIFAEPHATVAFAGARVIRETIRQELPEGFQTSEFLHEKGLIDRIVSRKEMRSTLAASLRYMTPTS